MQLSVRNSIKVLLFNEKKQLLLICTDDPKTTSSDGTYHGRFWSAVGGKIEEGESEYQAALRELYEETGLVCHEVELGPIVWFGEFEMVVAGKPTLLKQRFLVAHTKKLAVTLQNLTFEEQEITEELAWFSLDDIKNCPDIIYPVVMIDYLPNIIAGIYPPKPLELDLGKKPNLKKCNQR